MADYSPSTTGEGMADYSPSTTGEGMADYSPSTTGEGMADHSPLRSPHRTTDRQSSPALGGPLRERFVPPSLYKPAQGCRDQSVHVTLECVTQNCVMAQEGDCVKRGGNCMIKGGGRGKLGRGRFHTWKKQNNTWPRRGRKSVPHEFGQILVPQEQVTYTTLCQKWGVTKGGCETWDSDCVTGNGDCVMGDSDCVTGDGDCVMGNGGCVTESERVTGEGEMLAASEGGLTWWAIFKPPLSAIFSSNVRLPLICRKYNNVRMSERIGMDENADEWKKDTDGWMNDWIAHGINEW